MISQPMHNKTNEQIRKEREQLVKNLEAEGYEVIDTIIAEDTPENCDQAIYYLSKSIEYLSKVDAVYFMRGWEKARGCKIEHEVAVEYNKRLFYENYEVKNGTKYDLIKANLVEKVDDTND